MFLLVSICIQILVIGVTNWVLDCLLYQSVYNMKLVNWSYLGFKRLALNHLGEAKNNHTSLYSIILLVCWSFTDLRISKIN